jgi:hypothetical protein
MKPLYIAALATLGVVAYKKLKPSKKAKVSHVPEHTYPTSPPTDVE